jgi:hypothetical protein
MLYTFGHKLSVHLEVFILKALGKKMRLSKACDWPKLRSLLKLAL